VRSRRRCLAARRVSSDPWPTGATVDGDVYRVTTAGLAGGTKQGSLTFGSHS
jgi:hypothetical protein